MYLIRLETQGFKTFAKKTVLEFPAKSIKNHALTVIVGPNGSGKSNLSDAMRWCLGEQSMKHLRGKKSEDIIFSGSKGKSRSGFAEVSMTFDNSDKTLNVDYSEVTITRRLFRDGDSEYLLNGKKARLSDIQLLLAEAGIGQRSYTVIGQGMIDHVLTSSPEERKIFFDDATGVRGFQIKRHQSMNKLRKSTENLIEIEMLLGEIEPRLRLLKRQVKRLEKREGLETDIKILQRQYFGTLWWKHKKELLKINNRLAGVDQKVKAKKIELQKGDDQLLEMEQTASTSNETDEETRAAQIKYRKAQQSLREIQQTAFEAEKDLEMAKIKAQSSWAPLPLSQIISELEEILKIDEAGGLTKLIKLVKTLRNRLTKPNPDDFTPDKEMVIRFKDAQTEIEKAKHNVKDAEDHIDALSKRENKSKTVVFEFQRKLRKIQNELYNVEQERNSINIEKARTETRIESLSNDMNEEIPEMISQISAEEPKELDANSDETRGKILRIKHQLELIGGIDQETIDEFKETEERYNFLNGQVTDLQKAIKTIEKIIDELDIRIREQSEKAFKKINEEFQKYFKVLFGGGSCSLIKLKATDEKEEESHISLDRAMEELAEEEIKERDELKNSETIAETALKRFKKRRDVIAGIDIQATPPGKKLKSLNLLSGGERALTSIALLSAIMATNPSPFVVLDEVDAALDEANTIRFANILDELRKLTQFIVITHNRATMERADLLYGVTMGDDGISNLLSVNMTDIDAASSARR